MAGETAGFGIRVNLVEPGYLRTDFLRTQNLRLPAQVADGYDAVREMTDAHLAMPGTQLGDPAKAATAIITIARSGTAPLHQILGSDSYALATTRVRDLTADIEAGRSLATTTDITENA